MSRPFTVERKDRAVRPLDEAAQRALDARNKATGSQLAQTHAKAAEEALTPAQYAFWLEAMRGLVGGEPVEVRATSPRAAAEALFSTRRAAA